MRADGVPVHEDVVFFLKAVFHGGRLTPAEFVKHVGFVKVFISGSPRWAWFSSEMHPNTYHMYGCQLCGQHSPVTARCLIARFSARAAAADDPNCAGSGGHGNPGNNTGACAKRPRSDVAGYEVPAEAVAPGAAAPAAAPESRLTLTNTIATACAIVDHFAAFLKLAAGEVRRWLL